MTVVPLTPSFFLSDKPLTGPDLVEGAKAFGCTCDEPEARGTLNLNTLERGFILVHEPGCPLLVATQAENN